MSASAPSSSVVPTTPRQIALRGVRVHNLQHLDLDLPLHQLVVITGVSGSGKSSLVRDTLLAEGRRRFLETLAPSLRQQAERIERPDAEQLTGIPPCLYLATDEALPRSWQYGTVASVSEIHELLGGWFARLATVLCPSCGREVQPGTLAAVLETVDRLPSGTKMQIGFDWQADPDAGWLATADDLLQMGYRRIVSEEATHSLSSESHRPEAGIVILDRLTAGGTSRERLLESCESAFHAARHGLRLLVAAGPAGTDCLTEFPIVEIDGRSWRSVHFPRGWTCGGCNRELLPLEPQLFRFWKPSGACPTCEGRGFAESGERFACGDCQGSGLREEARFVRFQEAGLPEWLALSASQLIPTLAQAAKSFNDAESSLVRAFFDELQHRLRMLTLLGLADLPLDRRLSRLASGELQRLRWMSLLGPKLTGTLVLLDEPTASCQPADLQYLLSATHELLDRRNSVIAVDHDPAFVAAADRVVELGPGPGAAGGRLVFEGAASDLLATAGTAAARAFEERQKLLLGSQPERRSATGWLTSPHLTIHGVEQPRLRVPLGVLAVVTGSCGAGKTEWLIRQLPACASDYLRDLGPDGQTVAAPTIAALEVIDQAPLSRSPRTTVVNWLGAFDEIREVFAETAEAKQRGWTSRTFSWQTADGGRCRQCRGTGLLKLDLEFLAEVTAVCPECHGCRFRREVLDVKYRGQSIADVLAMTIDEAAAFFRSQPRLQQKFQWLKTAGLGYLALGQSAATLSGGEAQRLKLASRLTGGMQGRCLFLCDQPSRGLHPLDIPALARCLHDLVSIGHSVVVIDHQWEMLFAADMVLELTGDSATGELHAKAISPDELQP